MVRRDKRGVSKFRFTDNPRAISCFFSDVELDRVALGLWGPRRFCTRKGAFTLVGMTVDLAREWDWEGYTFGYDFDYVPGPIRGVTT